jgi:hypothetical protein
VFVKRRGRFFKRGFCSSRMSSRIFILSLWGIVATLAHRRRNPSFPQVQRVARGASDAGEFEKQSRRSESGCSSTLGITQNDNFTQ